MRYQKYKCTSS